MLMIDLILHVGVFIMVVQAHNVNCQKLPGNYKAALFARPEKLQSVEAKDKFAFQNSSATMDAAVENILKWLQIRYQQQRNRITRQETFPNMGSPNHTLKPQPFSVPTTSEPVTDASTSGYLSYDTYPTPYFNPYNQSYQSSLSPFNQQSTIIQYQPPPSFAPSPEMVQNRAENSAASDVSQSSTTPEPPYTYLLPDSHNPDFDDNTEISNSIIPSEAPFEVTGTGDLSTTSQPSFASSNFSPSDENVIISNASEQQQANSTSVKAEHQAPHVHAINVQCSKDKMDINLEFSDVYNGIVYSKGYYNDPKCHFVKKNSGQKKYSFVVQLNACGTQFIDEFYKGKQAFLENILVLQNEAGIQEVWDVIRNVRCLWEGSIKQTLSAGLNVETINQDVITFSGDMIAARLEIQVGKGPNAPSANGFVTIGDTMTLVVTVDGDAAFNVLVRSCIATDGNPNSGNVIHLTDDDGCVLKPKFFGNFQTVKNPDPNRPSVVSYAYFQAFKFPDVMDLLIECNVELCKNQCQACTLSVMNTEPARHKRLVSSVHHANPNISRYLSEKLRVISPDEIKFVTAMALRNSIPEIENHICLSETIFYLQYIIISTILCSSVIIILIFWIKLKKFSDKTRRIYY